MPIIKISHDTQVVTASTTLTDAGHIVRVDASLGPVTVTLPGASIAQGLVTRIKKVDTSANAVTIAAPTGMTIDGVASITLSSPGESADVFLPLGGTNYVSMRGGGGGGGGGGGPQPLKGTATWAPGTLLAGQYVSTTVTVTGAQPGMPAVASHTGVSDPAVVLSATVSSANTVSVAAINLAGVSVTIPSGTLTVLVFTN